MAKNASSASPVTPGRLPDKDFFSRVSPADSRIPAPEARQVSSKQVLGTLKAYGKGWDAELEKLLNVPDRLFMLEMDDATYYSSENRFGFSDMMLSMGSGTLKRPPADYGIALYGKGGSVYFILADMNRRIVVRERLHCIHENPPERDWGQVKAKIKDALALAERGGNKAAVYDQVLLAAEVQ